MARPLLALACLLAAATPALGAPAGAEDTDGVIVKLASGGFSIQEAAAADARGELGEAIGEDLRRYKLQGNETVQQVAQRLAAVPGEREPSRRPACAWGGGASACMPCATCRRPAAANQPTLPSSGRPAGVEYAVPDRRIWTEALKAEGDEGGVGGGPDDGVPRSYPESKGFKLQVRRGIGCRSLPACCRKQQLVYLPVVGCRMPPRPHVCSPVCLALPRLLRRLPAAVGLHPHRHAGRLGHC